MNCLCWNIRGIGNKKSIKRLRKLVKIKKALLVCLLEPLNNPDKMERLARSICLPNYYFNSLAPRKMWLMWNDDVEIVVINEHSQALIVDVSVRGAASVRCSFVYAACDIGLRKQLWEHLISLSSLNVPWMIAGDFKR